MVSRVGVLDGRAVATMHRPTPRDHVSVSEQSLEGKASIVSEIWGIGGVVAQERNDWKRNRLRRCLGHAAWLCGAHEF